MSKEKTKHRGESEPRQEHKAKVAIVDIIDGVPSILTLTRSAEVESRPNEADWAGGGSEPKDNGDDFKTMLRETEEELPGTTLFDVQPLDVRQKINKDGVLIVTTLFAARAIFPEDGIQLSDEHSHFSWDPIDGYENVDIPNKYRNAVAAESKLVVSGLADLALRDYEPAYV